MKLECLLCNSDNFIKVGYTKQKKQRYQCKNCGKRFIDYYNNTITYLV